MFDSQQFPAGEVSIPHVLLSRPQRAGAAVDELVQDALRVVREHLGMDVAFVSEFENGRRTFRFVDATDESPIAVGGSDPLDESYCQRVVDGRLPELIHDARAIPEALKIPATTQLPVGAHLSVPLRLSDGDIYGTFCCFSRRADTSLDERDLGLLRLFADFTARLIEGQLVEAREREAKCERITDMLSSRAWFMAYQPIFRAADTALTGFEALTRFTADPKRTPDVWFGEAAAVGLGEQLEMAVIETALAELPQLPADSYLALNVAPENVINGALAYTLRDAPLERIVMEVTEHAAIPDYATFQQEVDKLRARGMRLAADDVGSGYASLNHVLQLNPDIIKLDVTLTRGIHTDRKRHALAAALVAFARETGGTIVAEGVETAAELAALRELGVERAQGYLLGKPMPLHEAVKLFA